MGNHAVEKLMEYTLLPLVRLDRGEDALPLADALRQGGLPCMAVTQRSAGCDAGVRAILAKDPSFLIGVGDVKSAEECRRAVETGAAFILSPVLNPEVIRIAKEAGVPVIPGAATTTEIYTAFALRAELVNYFPAGALGGVRMLRAVSGPLDDARFLVSNGVDESNMAEYLSFGKVRVLGIKHTASVEMVDRGAFGEITDKTRAAVRQLQEIRAGSVG